MQQLGCCMVRIAHTFTRVMCDCCVITLHHQFQPAHTPPGVCCATFALWLSTACILHVQCVALQKATPAP